MREQLRVMNQEHKAMKVHEAEALQEQANQKAEKSQSDFQRGTVKVEFYTDPLCCWSWAFETSWKRFLEVHGHRISFEYVMCGMIADWKTYNDPMNSVSNPVQMGPVWMHASQVTRTPMKYSIWHEDPPHSSYPSCIAVKTAQLQSAEAGNEYLFRIRKALMEEGKNISRKEILLEVAETVNSELLDFDRFVSDLRNDKGLEPFKADLRKARYHNIGRFPTLTFVNESGKGCMTVGYRPYEVLLKAFENVF